MEPPGLTLQKAIQQGDLPMLQQLLDNQPERLQCICLQLVRAPKLHAAALFHWAGSHLEQEVLQKSMKAAFFRCCHSATRHWLLPHFRSLGLTKATVVDWLDSSTATLTRELLVAVSDAFQLDSTDLQRLLPWIKDKDALQWALQFFPDHNSLFLTAVEWGHTAALEWLAVPKATVRKALPLAHPDAVLYLKHHFGLLNLAELETATAGDSLKLRPNVSFRRIAAYCRRMNPGELTLVEELLLVDEFLTEFFQ